MVDVESDLQMQQLSTSLRKSIIHRTLEPMRAKRWLEVRDTRALPPQLLRQRGDLNPEVVVALQVDDQDCFMRLLVTIPHFQEIFSKLCFPMLHLDGAHSKSTLCDGVMILIAANLGNGTQLHVGFMDKNARRSISGLENAE
jgi:hypothetical protein